MLFIDLIQKNMKRIFFIPRITTISLALMLTCGVIVVSEMSCAKKAVYGAKPLKHKAHKKKGLAPGMGG